MSSIVLSVAPTLMPVTLAELKARLKITHSDMDSTLQDYLAAATEYAQEYQWSQLCTATYVERFDSFPCEIRTQRNPVQSVTSLAYVDTAGNSQTLVQNTDYTVDVYAKPARIIPAYSKSWPATYGHLNDVTLTYVAGYGTAADVPEEIRHAILLKAAQQYGDCGGNQEMVDKAINSLLDKRSFRTWY